MKLKNYKLFYILSIILLALSIIGLGLTIFGVIFKYLFVMRIVGVVGLIMALICLPGSYLMDYFFKKVTKDHDNIQK